MDLGGYASGIAGFLALFAGYAGLAAFANGTILLVSNECKTEEDKAVVFKKALDIKINKSKVK